MNTLFTAEAISKGGRSGTLQAPDRLWFVTLGNPLEKGIETRGPTPELLFAGAYAACFHSAMTNVAKKLGTPVEDSTVRALVSLIEDDQGGYRIAVELMRISQVSIILRCNSSWRKRIKVVPIPKPCVEIPPSGWRLLNQSSRNAGSDHNLTAILAAIRNRK